MLRKAALFLVVIGISAGSFADGFDIPSQSEDAARVFIRSTVLEIGNYSVFIDGGKAMEFGIIGECAVIDLPPGDHVVNVYHELAAKLSKTNMLGDIGLELAKGQCVYLRVLHTENDQLMLIVMEKNLAAGSRKLKYLNWAGSGGLK